jgi:hypothetical protein
LAILNRFHELKRSERDPLGEENIEEALDALQMGLDLLGLIPVIGEPFDAASGIISAARGDVLGASLSFAAMVTVVGGAAGAAKLLRNTSNAIEPVEDATKATQELVEQVRQLDGAADTVVEGAFDKALRDIDTAIDTGHITESQAVDALQLANKEISEAEARGIISRAREVGDRRPAGWHDVPGRVAAHDVGVQLGRAYAKTRLGLKETN